MKKVIILVVVLGILIAGFYLLNGFIYKEKQGDGGVQADYKNISYMIEGRAVRLENGMAEDAIEGSASKTTTQYFGNAAEGDLNADGISDIAFLLTQDGGGSGTFFYVVAALKSDVGYTGTNAVFLGDRIAPQTTEIRNGGLIVNFAERRAEEPMTASPSVGRSMYLHVSGDELREDNK